MKVNLLFCDEYHDGYKEKKNQGTVDINTMDELVELCRNNSKTIPNESGNFERAWMVVRYEKDSKGHEDISLIVIENYVDDFLYEKESVSE